MMRTAVSAISTAIAITVVYVVFCGMTFGYYVDPEEWFTGAFYVPAGHICLSSPTKCQRLADDYSFDTGGIVYDGGPADLYTRE